MNTRQIPLSRLAIGRGQKQKTTRRLRVCSSQLEPISDLFEMSESEPRIADEDANAPVRWTVAWLYLLLYIGRSFHA